MVIFLTFRLQRATLPSREEHFGFLWRIARLFEPFGLPIDIWRPPAPTRKKSLANAAFDRNGPTSAALEIQRIQDEKVELTNYRRTGVWSGSEKGKGGAISVSLSSDPGLPTCLLYLQFNDVDALERMVGIQQFMLGLLDIWPFASDIQVGPLKYFTTQQVFPKRPGAGWMLYLPTAITREQLPEAAALMPVIERDQQKGTIIVSISDGAFSSDNPEHVKTANAIEIRLADQDLLPR